VTACGVAPDAPAGLEQIGYLKVPTVDQGWPHMVEIEAEGDDIYIANSWQMLSTFRRELGGGIATGYLIGTSADRCTTLALHSPSRTVFCASEVGLGDRDGFSIYDVTTPDAPVLRELIPWPPEPATDPIMHTRHVHVEGDVLHAAMFQGGLWSADIGAGGSLSGFRKAAVSGNILFVEGEGQHLTALAIDRLAALGRDAEGQIVERGSLPLDGPAIHLRVRGDRALVALGSQGARVVDLSADPPAVIADVRPAAVALSADLDGDALAVMTVAGAFLYDLSTSPPCLAGFAPSDAIMMDGVFHDGELLVNDWLSIERFTYRLDGRALALDLSEGAYVKPGEPVSWGYRNPGGTPLRAVFTLDDEVVVDAVVAPGELRETTLPATTYAPRLDDTTHSAPVRVSIFDVDGDTSGTPLWSGVTILNERSESIDPGEGHPAAGDAFTPLTLLDKNDGPMTLPLAGESFWAVFFTTDCAMMWAEAQDLAWLSRKGDTGLVPPVLITEFQIIDRPGNGFSLRWALDGLRTGKGEDNIYYARFQQTAIPAAPNPTDYLIDEHGKVVALERIYRGAFRLH
jgi:hypothetical protein